MSASLSSIADFIRFTYSELNRSGAFCGHGTDNSWDEAVHLVLESLSLPWDFDSTLWACCLTEQEKNLLLQRIHDRVSKRVPLPYLTNKAWFCGLEFYVDERVLVPRSPIGELIEKEFAPWLSRYPSSILDLCCGSGCIGIACAVQFPDSAVDLADISEDALEVARINQRQHLLESRTRRFKSDLFASLPDPHEHQYDLIVSNPPYVNREDLESMPPEFSREPVLGLEAGEDGLEIVHRILGECGPYLKSDGLLVVELGNSWPALEQAYPEVPFTWVEFEHGGHGVFCLSAEEIHKRDW